MKVNPGMGILMIEPPSLQSTLPGHNVAHPVTDEVDDLLLDKKVATLLFCSAKGPRILISPTGCRHSKQQLSGH